MQAQAHTGVLLDGKARAGFKNRFGGEKKIKAHCENPFYSVNRMIFCHQKRGKQRVSF
jgi:hypothetical protein